jgi:predicted acylesterase/phospholipase RssA
MAYDIELLSLGEDLYPLLKESAASLNAVQQEFTFRLTSPQLRESGLAFRRAEYSTGDIWAYLRDQRTSFGGNRPYIIAFVNAPLKSSELANIFGSHEAAEGLAAVTIHASKQYVKEARRYCCYYLVRYALSFANPLIRAHTDPTRKNCYFHKKLYKPDIRASMDSGHLCDNCMGELDHPPPGATARPLSAEEREAIRKMRLVVSGAFPHAIVMKGGGVKGLAFAGALLELEKYFWFDRHVGASAGAITAVLLAADYSPGEVVEALEAKDFRDFMDAPFWKVPFNLLFRRGCYPGEHFRKWIATMLGSKIPMQSELMMRHLNGAIVYASRRGSGTLVFDSAGERRDTGAAFATRCSISIPIVFVAPEVEGRKVYDGGLRNNFPLSKFLADHPNTPFIALYLAARDDRKGWLGSDLLDILIEGEERQVVDANAGSIVVIDTAPIGTVDFGIQEVAKQFLVKAGRAAALQFLAKRNLDDGPDEASVVAAQQEAEVLRREVRRLQKRSRWRRALVVLGLVFLGWTLIWCALQWGPGGTKTGGPPSKSLSTSGAESEVGCSATCIGWCAEQTCILPVPLMTGQAGAQGLEAAEIGDVREGGARLLG